MENLARPASLPDEPWEIWKSFYGDRELLPPFAAVYPRVSSDGQEEGWSLASQLKAELERAIQDGVSVLPEHVYYEVHTAEELWERPELTRMRADFKRKAFDVAYFYDVSRFSRRSFYMELVLDEATRAGIRTDFILQAFDDTPEGRLLRQVAGYTAEKELYAIKERTNRGKKERLSRGIPLGSGKPPYGYVWATPISEARRDQNVAFAVDPRTAPIVERIFKEIADGRPIRAVTADLMRDGILTPAGKRVWQTGTVSVILRNEAYIGRSFANRWHTFKVAGKKRTTARPREEWIALADGTYPRIVSDEDWNAAQSVKETNKALATRNSSHPQDFLLRGGFVRCGACNGSMTARTYKSGYTIYICHGAGPVHGTWMPREQRPGVTRISVNSQALDAAVWAHVTKMLTNEDYLGEALARLVETDRASMDMAAISARLADVDAQLGNLALAVATANPAVVALLTNQMNTLSDQRVSLERERSNVSSRAVNALRARDQIERLRRTLGAHLPEVLEAMPYEERRKALMALGVRVTVEHRPAKGKWGLPPYRITSSPEYVDSDKGELWLESQATRSGITLIWDFEGGRLAS